MRHYINGNVPLAISITDALSPYSHRPASGGAFVFSFGLLPVAVWLTSGLFSAAAWAPASWHSAGMDALAALDEALRAVFFVRRVRVVWESSFGRLFVFGAIGASGTWQQFARIGWLRGTVEDDEQDRWWEQFFLRVPAFKSLAYDVFSRNQRQRGVGVCGRELPGSSRVRSLSRARSLWREDPQVPFQNGATRGAGSICGYVLLIRRSRRDPSSTEASRRL